MTADTGQVPRFHLGRSGTQSDRTEHLVTNSPINMKKIVLLMSVLLLVGSTANAQNILQRLGEKAKEAAEQNIGNKVEKGVNDVLDSKVGKKDKKAKKGKTEVAEEAGAETAAKPAPVKQVATEYAKSDFVPGDEIFFDDDFAGERLGEFASRWELLDGYAEVASVEGRKVLAFTDDGVGTVIPLMKDKLAFLPDVFTVEYDLYVAPVSDDASDSKIEISLCFGRKGQDYDSGGEIGNVRFFYTEEGDGSLNWLIYKPNSDSSTDGTKDLGLSQSFSSYNGKDNPLKAGQWNHFAFSFNKRAFKGYINGQRIISIPSAAAPAYVMVRSAAKYRYSGISNFRMAKGAVPLYDRLASDGKIVTYAITFETGKADLKPESMVEILRISKLMQENPGLEFEVQGHCDNTGSDKVNDPLSQKRAEAIVTALVEQGIAESRLTPVGKGSHVPIASNSTDEGRARNRRVEFVKK